MGDLNAKVGMDNIGNESVTGKEGIGIRNENGETFIELCQFKNLIIGGTRFQKKDIYKATWVSPNRRTKNRIDHIAVNTKWKSSLLDVSACRGADVGSDHYLVTGEIRLFKVAEKKTDEEYIRKQTI
ncbi:hypothetical protein FSP39_000335 [Pinctada imbricata]|uniref:Craniofacial development protein 2-like protein n=1 Tax=Pinctada imbricata TaxID=66713 RepID=A0AA89C695_PINIB|nr:hypothetical protein FSP39_000335 [Pinctada imbricata]